MKKCLTPEHIRHMLKRAGFTVDPESRPDREGSFIVPRKRSGHSFTPGICGVYVDHNDENLRYSTTGIAVYIWASHYKLKSRAELKRTLVDAVRAQLLLLKHQYRYEIAYRCYDGSVVLEKRNLSLHEGLSRLKLLYSRCTRAKRRS